MLTLRLQAAQCPVRSTNQAPIKAFLSRINRSWEVVGDVFPGDSHSLGNIALFVMPSLQGVAIEDVEWAIGLLLLIIREETSQITN